MRKISKNQSAILRSKAEELLKKNPSGIVSPVAEEEVFRLINEMELYRIELEMQNEELVQAKSDAQRIADNYIELYDFASSGYVTLNRAGTIDNLNLTLAKMLGKERLNLLNKPFVHYVSNDTKAIFWKFLDNSFETGKKSNCEIVLSTETLENFKVHIEGTLSEDKGKCHITITDKTSEFNALKQLETSLIYQSLILQGAGEGIMGIDRKGCHLFVNQMAAKLLGYNEEELLGKQSHELYHNHFHDGSIYPVENCPISIIAVSGKPFIGEEYFWHKSGRCFPVELSCLPIFKDDEITGSVVTFRDITSRKNSERDRLQSEKIMKSRLFLTEFALGHSRVEIQQKLLEELESLTGSTLSFIHVLDEDQNTLTFQSWSPNSIRSLIESKTNPMPKSITTPAIWAECIHSKKAVIHNDIQSITDSFGLPAGHFVIFRELVAPIIRNDTVVAIIGIGNKQTCYDENDIGIVSLLADMAWDISERKGAEEELSVLNAKLEERIKERTSQLVTANIEMEAFAYSVSHDLRAPLRHITGFVAMLKELEAPYRTSEEVKYLDIISKGAEEMGKLIDALLSFSKIQRVDLKKSAIRTSELVKSAVGFLMAEMKERKIEFRIGILPDCLGDEQLIKLVWINLISNALKYTSKKEKAEIEIDCIENDNEKIFAIRDNGAGFDMQYAGKLFRVFQRLHKQRDFEGIGIGLANVNSIISRHGGSCRAEGQVDHGAVFYFSLPK